MEGTPFGRYRLLGLLGRGGMGEVWRAYDPTFDRVIALKVLPPNFAGDRVFQERFRREARAAAGLDEPHVVPIHDFGEVENRLFVTMRLVDGQDLQTLLKDGPIAPSRAVNLVEQIAFALHAAHNVGLVHRDVKPSNILIAENDFAYLIDFGIARSAGETGLTSTGATIGTWSYMAPERFRSGIADTSADTYALTCVLHQALTGELPFPANTLEQIAVAHMFQPPPKPSSLRPGIPVGMDEVIARGMAKVRDDRYGSTKDLAIAARAALTPRADVSRSPEDELESGASVFGGLTEPRTQTAETLEASSTYSPAISGSPSTSAPPLKRRAETSGATRTQAAPISGSNRGALARPSVDARLPRQIPSLVRSNPGAKFAVVAAAVFVIGAVVTVIAITGNRAPASGYGVSGPGSATSTTIAPNPVPLPSAPMQLTDYTGLLIQVTDIDAPVPFTASPPTNNPNGQPGVATTFSTQDGSHVIKDTIQVLADPAAATDALNAAKAGQGAALKNPTTDAAKVGTNGTVLSGNSPDNSKGDRDSAVHRGQGVRHTGVRRPGRLAPAAGLRQRPRRKARRGGQEGPRRLS